MQIKLKQNLNSNLNSLDLKERLNGNPLFLHTFKGFATSSSKISFMMHAVHALLTIILILTIVYGYFVVGSVLNIIDKKVSITNINNLNSSIAKIENDYTKKVASINIETITALGFVKVDQNNFAEKVDTAASLSFLFER